VIKCLNDFSEIWVHDFEYRAPPGDHVIPHCLVAHELRSGRWVRLWRDQLGAPPYRLDPDCLFVAYNAAAELGCHLALGWSLPIYVLDLFVEFKNLTNGKVLPSGAGLLGALAYFRLDSIAATAKEETRALAIRGGPFTEKEKADLLEYCETDVVALPKLLGRMAARICLPQALHRGRFQRAIAMMEYNGVPIDTDTLDNIRRNWDSIKLALIAEVDKNYGVFDGTRFKLDRFAALLRRLKIHNWPVTDIGRLSKSDEVFKKMSQAYPVLQPLRELNFTISKLRLERLTVGSDGRNRTSLWAFGTKTGRNTPKATEFIYCLSGWVRFNIKPGEGFALAYIDYSSQEYGVAAVLSGDDEMIRSYSSGDPYLSFAKSAGAVPQSATKTSHSQIRDVYKLCSLGILYGMQAKGLATYSGQSEEMAERILESHRRIYAKFWQWSDSIEEQALLKGKISTRYGWQFSAPWQPSKPNSKKRSGTPVRTIRNFPVQAGAAEMFRLSCCLMVERGVTVCAPVHDAVLIEAPLGGIEEAVSIARSAMAEASLAVLSGKLELRTDCKIFTDRYVDERGAEMWNTVTRLSRDINQRPKMAANPVEQLELRI
jgi:DNA polymerase-1